jgi:methanogenic corrinoid protein MtbC1
MTTTQETIQKYYDALIEGYDLLVDAIEKANERGIKVSRQLAADVIAGQREALQLGKKLAAEPADLGQLYAGLLEATTAAQGRALAFTQVAYQEALASGADARELIKKLAEANRETAAAAVEVARQWTTANPFADFMKKSFEAFQPAETPKAKKEEAPASA